MTTRKNPAFGSNPSMMHFAKLRGSSVSQDIHQQIKAPYYAKNPVHRLELDLCFDYQMDQNTSPQHRSFIPRDLAPEVYKAYIFLYFIRGKFSMIMRDVFEYVELCELNGVPNPHIRREDIEILLTSDTVVFSDPDDERKRRVSLSQTHPFHSIAMMCCAPTGSYPIDFEDMDDVLSNLSFDERFIFIRAIDEFHKDLEHYHLIEKRLLAGYVNCLLPSLVCAFIKNRADEYFSVEEVVDVLKSLNRTEYGMILHYDTSDIDEILYIFSTSLPECHEKIDALKRGLDIHEAYMNYSESAYNTGASNDSDDSEDSEMSHDLE